jgi:hypothetical protein
MNADGIVKALRRMAENSRSKHDVLIAPADLIESLQAQLTASQRRADAARNELCLKCGLYHNAHNGACDRCRWKE